MRVARNLKNRLILSTSSLISQRYSNIASSVVLQRGSPEKNLFLVTSACSREGRSLTAMNLAIVLANWQKKVLLIDGDLRNPTIHTALDTKISYVFSDIIMKDIDFNKAIVGTSNPYFYILPSQRSEVDPLAVLISPAVSKLFEQLKSAYDFVIIDSPPLLQFRDASILAPLVDGVLLVVHLMKSRRTSVRMAVERMKKDNGKIMGIVVNT